MSTSSRSLRFSRRNAASSSRSALLSPSRVPVSTSAWRTQARTAVSVSSKSLATWPTERSPRRHSSTISALNSGVNERRGRFFFPMLSMMDILPGTNP